MNYFRGYLRKIADIFYSLSFADLSRIFFYLFFCLLPFQVKTLIFTGDVYGSGFFNPYLSQFLYIGDLLLILCLVFLGLAMIFDQKEVEFKIKNFWLVFLMGIFVCTAVFSFLVSADRTNTFLYILRYLEFFVVFLLLAVRFVQTRTLFFGFIVAMTISACVGIAQYLVQRSVGLSFLGEPMISSTTLGVAKVALLNSSVLRAYGTFPHPNLFAGYLFFAILFLIYKWKNLGNLAVWISIVLGIAFVFTFSRSVALALVSGLVLYVVMADVRLKWKYLFWSVLALVVLLFVFDLFGVIQSRLLFGDSNTLVERSMLYAIGEKMFVNNWLGVGVGNFTEGMQRYVDFKLMPWQYQPVHNMFMLVLNESGIVGFMAFVGVFGYALFYLLDLLKKQLEDKKLVVVLLALWTGIFVIGLFDHYFVSLYQGQALLWLFFGLVASL